MRALAIAIVLTVAAAAARATPAPVATPPATPTSAPPPAASPPAAGPDRTSPATASEAAQIFEHARELARLGRLAEACEQFGKSYALDPAPGTAVNLADCLEREGQLRRAWQLFDDVARNPTVQSRARLARQRADALLARLATVIVRIQPPIPAGLTVQLGDHALPAATAASLPAPAIERRDVVEPSELELTAAAPGRAPFRTTVHAVAGATVTVDVPAFPVLFNEPGTQRLPAWIHLAEGLGGASAVSLGVALGLAISARHTYDGAFDHDCSHTAAGAVCDVTGKATIDRAGRRADVATGFAIGGAVLAGAAVAALVIAPYEGIQVSPVAGSGALGIAASGRF